VNAFFNLYCLFLYWGYFVLFYFIFSLFRQWLSEAQPGHLRLLWGHDGSKSFEEEKKKETLQTLPHEVCAPWTANTWAFLTLYFRRNQGICSRNWTNVIRCIQYCFFVCICVYVCVCVFCHRRIVPYFLIKFSGLVGISCRSCLTLFNFLLVHRLSRYPSLVLISLCALLFLFLCLIFNLF